MLLGMVPMPSCGSFNHAWSHANVQAMVSKDKVSKPGMTPADVRRVAEAFVTAWRKASHGQ
jgi:hypothetical protein